jgi:hypothetical protein
VLEITIVRPIAPIVRNNPIAIWCIRNNNTKYLIAPPVPGGGGGRKILFCKRERRITPMFGSNSMNCRVTLLACCCFDLEVDSL